MKKLLLTIRIIIAVMSSGPAIADLAERSRKGSTKLL